MPLAPARANEAFVSGDGTVIPPRLPERRTAEGTAVTAHGTHQSLPCRGLLGQVAAVTNATALGARIAAAVVLRDYLAKRKDKR
jgi:hypothetical protein